MTTTARTVSDIAEVIREIDGDNAMPASRLGREIAWHARAPKTLARVLAVDVAAFVERTNADKALPPARLAELLVAEFDLDKEQ
uniref:hypothetical protein n=1 Tax=Paractinoplanes polyasparticus TaxID=2856853 RepID=UPI001C86443C|nr:hypothetical protein [Actinoplanes polyasparticus]